MDNSLKTRLSSITRSAVKGYPRNLAKQLSAFIRDYFREVPADELAHRSSRSLACMAKSHFELARSWTRGYRTIHVYNPEKEADGWASENTIIQIVSANIPFLIDSVMMELNRLGYTIKLTIHPLLHLQRDNTRKISAILPFSAGVDSGQLESFIYMEVEKESDSGRLKQLATALNRILADTRLAIKDWKPMVDNFSGIIQVLEDSALPVKAVELKQSIAFLRWLLDDNFIFLGYRNYNLGRNRGKETLRIVRGSGRGILRERGAKRTSRAFDILPEEIKKHAQSSKLLTITKSNSRSTIHRPVYLDYIGIKRFNRRGKVAGEHRILGLYTSKAYMSNPLSVPLINDKIKRVMKKSGLVPDSHASKALMNILLTYPRDELFQTDIKHLYGTAMGILNLQERQQVRLFARRDPFDRFFACIIFVPKDRFNSLIRQRIQTLLQDAFNGLSIDFSTSISESAYAQLYLIIHTLPGTVPKHDLRLLEADVAAITRSWQDELKIAFQETTVRPHRNNCFNRYENAFPAAYRDDHSAQEAILDSKFIDLALEQGKLTLNLYRNADSDNSHFMLKLFQPESVIPLSTVMPILENMGLFIESERPYRIQPKDTACVWVHNFCMKYHHHGIPDLFRIKGIFQEAFINIWHGCLENDGLNRLVLSAGLSAREIILLRVYAKYIRQLGTSFSESYIQDALNNNPRLAKLLTRLFIRRFDPGLSLKRGKKGLRRLQHSIQSALDAVSSLDEDRILRRFFDLIRATLRTNYFQLNEQGQWKDYLSLKVSPEQIPDLPLPCPKYEIFVYSPAMEGIHLRGGKVARGGIRWSDRRDDFRTEVLGLMNAQMVKNAVIVPVGAKGGFYVKHPPVNDRQALREEAISCYRTLIRGLLDITDNQAGDRIIPPLNTVCYDDADPYLVVAADKGTATFSDIANALAAQYKFWLGDAFASGGSDGYDHKSMGITARGAWESVKHNFQALNIDIQHHDFTVVGIGDMAGDVFGNAMLLSPHIKLVAAFNHMHIFIDPTPDPQTSFAERLRLFALPRSNWADYDRHLISGGGGIYLRSAKSIALSEQVKSLLQVDMDRVRPDELIRLLLMAPVDLLWNGGIGTYVKADDELNMEVGDKANDSLRINSSQLRCKVIGEGGNLGVTQRARIEFDRNKGRVNADWIDNSAGVDCSDREVNIKILLNKLLVEGKLSLLQRNRLLHKMTGNVSELVLQDNYRQVRAIDVMQIESVTRPGWYALLIDELERSENFSREREHVPTQATIEKRKALQQGFSHPEIAVLLAHTKTVVYNRILDSRLPDDPYLEGMLIRYFPVQLQKKYAPFIREHRLRREIVATVLTNSMVNRAGITFAHRLADETGASVASISKAYLVARDVFDIHGLWLDIDRLDHKVSVRSQAELVFETQHLIRHATRWFIHHNAYLDEVTNTVKHFSAGIKSLKLILRQVLTGSVRKRINEKIRAYRNVGIPARIASRFASLRMIIISLELNRLALQRDVDIKLVIELFFLLDSTLKIYSLRYNADMLATENVWQDRARVDFIQELNQLQTALTASALNFYRVGDGIAGVIKRWLDNNIVACEQYQDIYNKMKFTETNELAMLTVVLSKLRKFIA